MRRAKLVALAMTLGFGCDESPYAPAAQAVPCGTEEIPCRFTCELGCAATMVDMAAGCMQSLQGTIDGSSTRCDFADGGRATFAWPVPAVGADLSGRSWKLKIFQADSQTPCIAVTAEPLPWIAGGFRSKTEVQTATASYSQELSMREDGSSSVLDGGGGTLPDPAQLHVRCPDGRHHRGEGRSACAACTDSDCRNLPLVELRAGWNGNTLDFELRAGDRVTPLFSCL